MAQGPNPDPNPNPQVVETWHKALMANYPTSKVFSWQIIPHEYFQALAPLPSSCHAPRDLLPFPFVVPSSPSGGMGLFLLLFWLGLGLALRGGIKLFLLSSYNT